MRTEIVPAGHRRPGSLPRVRVAGFQVLELGTDVPPEPFVLAAERAEGLVAVRVGVTTIARLEAASVVVETMRQARPDVPVLLGGQAVRNPMVAAALSVSEWAPDGEGVVAVVERLACSRRQAGSGASS